MSNPVLMSYKLTTDAGFAPNPFWGQLTLATCKPGIRERGKPGDWVAGFTGKMLCDWASRRGYEIGEAHLIFLMQIDRVITYDAYYRSSEFQQKIPVCKARDYKQSVGDNIYFLDAKSGQYQQVENPSHGAAEKDHDLHSHNVLIAKRFAYFGSKPLRIPKALLPQLARNYTVAEDTKFIDKFVQYVELHAGFERNPKAMPISLLRRKTPD